MDLMGFLRHLLQRRLLQMTSIEALGEMNLLAQESFTIRNRGVSSLLTMPVEDRFAMMVDTDSLLCYSAHPRISLVILSHRLLFKLQGPAERVVRGLGIVLGPMLVLVAVVAECLSTDHKIFRMTELRAYPQLPSR
jgi:hypothetical protein